MPFTPLHFGIGIPTKALFPRQFSLTAFALTQVAIDLEPLYYMLQGEAHLHRFWHTYLGASILALMVALLNKPFCRLLHRVFEEDGPCSRKSAWISAFFGAYSHVFLDSLMHRDIQPWLPLDQGNALQALITYSTLQNSLIGGIVAGSWVWYVRSSFAK